MTAPRVDLDPVAGAAYVTITSQRTYRTVELGYGVLVDLDRTGNVVGVEILWTGTADNERVAALGAEMATRYAEALEKMSHGVDDPRDAPPS